MDQQSHTDNGSINDHRNGTTDSGQVQNLNIAGSIKNNKNNNRIQETANSMQTSSEKMDEKHSKMFHSLLEMMKMSSIEEIAQKLCLMSQLPLLCEEMRNYGCLPMLVRLLHQHILDDRELVCEELQKNSKARRDLVQAMSNIINHTSKNKIEIQILKILEDLKAFVEILFMRFSESSDQADLVDHPCNLIENLYRMCSKHQSVELIELFGGVHVISEVIKIDFKCHENSKSDDCHKIRLYSLMILTHLTYDNPQIKSLLGSKKTFLMTLISLLKTSTEDLIQAVAKVLQNLSWDTNYISMQTMRDVQTVTHLTNALLKAKQEPTIKCLLAALGNLTASSPPNKADFCKVDGGLLFLISILSSITNNNNNNNNKNKKNVDKNDDQQQQQQQQQVKTNYSMSVVEASGFILRNISSYIATEEKYRKILRENNVIPVLLEHLESSSLDVVSNACVILSNLSASTTEESNQDQIIMIESNAIKKLANLKNSKHRIISEGSLATYRHLVTSPAFTIRSSFNENNNLLSFSSFPMRKIKMKNEFHSSLLSTPNIDGGEINLNGINKGLNLKTTTSANVTSSNNRSFLFNFDSSRKFSRSTSHDSIGSFSSPANKQYHFQSSTTTMTKSMCNTPITTSSNMIIKNANCDNETISNFNKGVSSEYDIFCGDVKCQIITRSSSSTNSSNHTSFIQEENELDGLDYTTDFSERYKEQNVDEFAAKSSTSASNTCASKPQSNNNNNNSNNNNNKLEAGDCGDSIKIYQTEGTPLVISLAPSLSDLRELDLKSIYEEDENKKSNSARQGEKSSHLIKNKLSAIESTSSTVNKSFTKPSPPPKPMNLVGVDDNRLLLVDQVQPPSANFKPDDDATNEQPTNNEPEYFPDSADSAIKFATEDTPAIISHGTSLSSLTVDDEQDVQLEISEEIKNIDSEPQKSENTMQESVMIFEKRLDPIGSVNKPGSKMNNNRLKLRDQEKQSSNISPSVATRKNISKINDNNREANTSPQKMISIIETNNDTKTAKDDTDIKVSVTPKNPPLISDDIDDDEDEQLLKECIECALPSQKKTQQTLDTSNNKAPNNDKKESCNNGASPNDSSKVYSTSNNNRNKSPRVQSSPSSHNKTTTRNNNLPAQTQMRMVSHSASGIPHSKSSPLTPLMMSDHDQKKQFHVENTPVQFKDFNSSLSSLSFDSEMGVGNIEDDYENKLLEQAINLGMNHNGKSGGGSSSAPASGTQSSSLLTGSTSANITSSGASSRSNIKKAKNKSVSKTTTNHNNIHGSSSIGISPNHKMTNAAASGASSSRINQSINHHRSTNNNRHITMDNSVDDDEKTYTICTQGSRQSNHQSNVNNSFTNRNIAYNSHTPDGASSRSSPGKPRHHEAIMSSKIEKNQQKNIASKQIPVPTVRTTIQNNKQIKQNINREKKEKDEINVEKLMSHSIGSLDDDKSSGDHLSFLDNTKPPSIMDNSSLMSQSSLTSSIDSEISDIVYDQIPIRKSSSNADLMVAKVASDCAKGINTLVQSCMSQNINKNGNGRDGGGGGDTSSSVRESSTSSLSTDFNLSKTSKNDINKNLLMVDNDGRHQKMASNDRTFEIQIDQQSRTMPKMRRNSGGNNNTDTRTYVKNDFKRNNNNSQDDEYKYYESDQSDTDISEVLPLDDEDLDPMTIILNKKPPLPPQPSSSSSINNTMIKQQSSSSLLYNKPNMDMAIPSGLDQSFHNQMSPKTNRIVQGKSSSSLSSSKNTKKIYPQSQAYKENYSYGHQLDKLEDMEPETRYQPPHELEQPFDFPNNQQLFYPFGCNGGGTLSNTSGGFNHHSRSLNRGHKFMVNNTKADFEDKDLLFTSKHRNRVEADHALYFQNKSNNKNIKTASKYFDRHPTTALSLANEDFLDSPPKPSMYNSNINARSSGTNQDQSTLPITNKKENKSLFSNIKSKLTASFSSSSNVSNNSSISSSNSSSTTSASKSVKPSKTGGSKITSFWRRSKSTHDKLDQTSPPTAKQQQLIRNQAGSSEILDSKSSTSTLSRFVPARRSLANHEVSGSNLVRSTTYDSLPISNKDQQLTYTKADHFDACLIQDGMNTRNLEGIHYGSLNNRKRNSQDEASSHGNMTFMTFVKSLNDNNNNNKNKNNNKNDGKARMERTVIGSSNNDSNNNYGGDIENPNKSMGRKKNSNFADSKKNNRETKTSDAPTTSSSSRKTCLVTTV